MKRNLPADFGVIVICMYSDLLFVKGCIESVRFFLGNVPICLLKDGDFDTSELERYYNAVTLEKKNIKSDFLKKNSFGWGITRMIAFWESPFKSFLLIDSDTCLWGDLSEKIELLRTFDLIIDHKVDSYPLSGINKYFFNTKKLSLIDKDFQYENIPLCNPAVLLAHRNIFDIEDYKKIIMLTQEHPDLFKFGDMGFFNYLIFKYKNNNKIKIKQEKIQEFITDISSSELAEIFKLDQIKRNQKIDNPIVLHYCGPSKPVVINKQGYNTDIFTFFRMKFYENNVKLHDIHSKLLKEDRSGSLMKRLNIIKED